MDKRSIMPLLGQLIWLWLLLVLECDQSNGQSFVTFDNEAERAPAAGSSELLSEEELERIQKEKTRNTVRLAATDQLNSEIITNRTRAYLNCESGEMIVKINFSAPFRGVAYSDYDRSSPCKFYGDGSKYYEMRLPLKGCGTKQEAPRLFINNIIVRFHRSLELEEDEIKTIICRYPPPQAPPPPSVVAPILESTVPVPVIVPSKLSEIELLLIICALLFLTLLLLGIGISYYCLKRRNIKIIKKRKIQTPSEITKVSTIFDQIRIPRAAISESSDYPSSESDERRTIISESSTLRNDQYRYQNMAFAADPYPVDNEKEDSITSFPLAVAHKPRIQTLNLDETLIENENVTEEEIIDAHHKRTTAALYKRLPTSKYVASIPDNDNWSQTETESKLSLAVYVKNRARPKVETININDTYLSNEYDQDINISDINHRNVTSNMYKKVRTPKSVASIPDNDDWSQTEYDIHGELVPYIANERRPKITSKTISDAYLDYQDATENINTELRHKSTAIAPKKLQLIKTDETFVTNINESEETLRITKDKTGFKSVPDLASYNQSTNQSASFDTSFDQTRNQRLHQQLINQEASMALASSSSYHQEQSSSTRGMNRTAPAPSTAGNTISQRVGGFDMEMIRDWTYPDAEDNPMVGVSSGRHQHHSHSSERYELARSSSGRQLFDPNFDDFDENCPECVMYRRGVVSTGRREQTLSGGVYVSSFSQSTSSARRMETAERSMGSEDLLLSEEKHWQKQLLQ